MGKKLLEPIQVGGMTLKNRIMFPPLTTGYEERDGSIGPRSLSFYERLAKGGTAYIVIGDVAPVRTASPTPMFYEDSQIPAFQKLADALHVHGSKLALQIFHPEYDVQGVGRLIMGANMVRKAAADAQAAGNEEECQKQTALAEKTTKEAIAFAKLLEEAGVDMIQVAQANHTGNMGETIPPMGDVSYNWTLPTAKKVKAVVSIPVATVGRVVTTEAGERILEQGEADVIGYGRSLLTDPDIAVKTAAGECIRECLNCNKGCVDAIQNRRYISCILNAENGDEATIFLKEAADPKKVAVVGAGIAGLEAARVAAKRGHQVALFEKGDKIGGQIHLAAVPPRKSEILRAITYYEKILPTLSIELKFHTQPTAQELNGFDTVIVAVGAHNMPLPMKAGIWGICNSTAVDFERF